MIKSDLLQRTIPKVVIVPYFAGGPYDDTGYKGR